MQIEDYVLLNATIPNQPLLVARIGYMWDQESTGPTFHAHIFCRGTNTVLGETANPRELFEADSCENCPLGSIVRKTKVCKIVFRSNMIAPIITSLFIYNYE